MRYGLARLVDGSFAVDARGQAGDYIRSPAKHICIGVQYFIQSGRGNNLISPLDECKHERLEEAKLSVSRGSTDSFFGGLSGW